MAVRWRVAPLALVLLTSPGVLRAEGEESLERLYGRAVAEGQEGRSQVAVDLFEEVLAKMPENDPLRTLALYGAARANQRIGTAEAACKAVERFKAFIGRTDAEPQKREKAVNGLSDLIAKCNEKGPVATKPTAAVSAPVAPPLRAAPPLEAPSSTAVAAVAAPTPHRADHTWAWMATGTAGAGLVGGTAFLLVGSSALSDGDAAEKKFHASGYADAKARSDARSADDRARTFGVAGYATLGVGLIAGGLAAWAWLETAPDGSPPAGALVPGPSGLEYVGVF